VAQRPTSGKSRVVSKGGRYQLEVPLDASHVGELGPDEDQKLKVVVSDEGGGSRSESVALGKDRTGVAKFEFDERPSALTVFIGPDRATDEELTQSQTITVGVGIRDWGEGSQLQLGPIEIAPYWWFWWLRWCREYVIRGRLVCPDGSPVPGAEVCAYDVDWWFWWSSKQSVGCATTDVNGAFEIRFRWCCGFWPWWWWRYRVWELDTDLAERVGAVVAERPEVEMGRFGNRPSLEVFEHLLEEDALIAGRSLEAADAPALDDLRAHLLERLPFSEELARLHIWPWWPWWPWWDCSPDIIFTATQECGSAEPTTIVDETVWDTRWNISSPLDVTLVSTSQACCLPTDGGGGECLIVDGVCGIPLTNVGGNLGAPATPAGYASPGAVVPGTSASNGDRPFGGGVTITKNPGDLVGVDYLELEMFDPVSTSWVPLPMGAELGYSREYWEPSGTPQFLFPPFGVQTLSGHRVWETREHFETASGAVWYPSFGWARAWLSHNFSLLAYLDTSKFTDGTYEMHAVGWNDGGGGTLTNRRVIPLCGEDEENRFVLTFDNRVEIAAGHPSSHNCGGVHACTLEPDTHISDVRINGASIDPCATVQAEGDLEIDFQVTDPDGHLAYYSLIATWGLNESKDLLALGTVTALGGGTFEGPTYGEALGQGASAPSWEGGSYTLHVPSAAAAFEEPCCYQLELRAHKRTIVDCWGGYAHGNITEYSLGVGIC
jgi:hypothetical protein